MIRCKPVIFIIIAALIFTITSPLTALAESAGLTWRFPGPEGSPLVHSVASGNGRLVAVGDWGTVLISTDGGTTWQSAALDHGVNLWSVTFGAGRFVAIGNTGTLVSTDGTDWRPALPAAQSMSFAGGRFFAGTISATLVSEDGVTWRRGPAESLRNVYYENGHWVGLTRTGYPASSDDGTTWQVQKVGSHVWTALTYGNGVFLGIALGEYVFRDGAGRRQYDVYRSSDGIIWTSTGTTLDDVRGLAFAGGHFLVTQGEWTKGGGPWVENPATSTDGITWTERDRTQTLNAIVGSSGSLVFGVDDRGLLKSSDGVKWEPVFLRPGHVQKLYNAQGEWYAVTDDSVFVSPDGLRWAKADPRLRTYVNGRWFYVEPDNARCGIGGTLSPCESRLQVSLDGAHWETHLFPLKSVEGLVYGNGRYVVGKVVSTDLAHWQANALEGYALKGSTFGGGLFVTVESYQSSEGPFFANVYTSPDGETWTKRELPAKDWVQGIAYGNGTYVVGASDNKVYVSTDGQNWRIQPTGVSVSVQEVTFVNGQFIATGWKPGALGPEGSLLLTSADGVTWKAQESPSLNTAAGAGGRTLLGGVGVLELNPPAGDAGCAARFSDLSPLHPACAAVERLAGEKMVGGYPDGTFGPERPVARAEFAKMLVLAAGLTPAPTESLPFTDVQGHWAVAQGYLQAVVRSGALGGYPDGTLRPDGQLTRSQLVKMVGALAGLKPEGHPVYNDIDTPAWYGGWVAAAYQAKLIGPDAANPLWTDPTFLGDRPVTRAEAVMFLANWLAVRR